jgi:hypothetical protein
MLNSIVMLFYFKISQFLYIVILNHFASKKYCSEFYPSHPVGTRFQ